MTNLLLIYADDLFCYRLFRDTFGPAIQTPNLDALAAKATVFEAAYATVPVCLPSRTATMTGWSPFESGAIANGAPDWYDLVPTRDNVSALLKRSGFYVEWAGKIMHLYGDQPPEQRRQLMHASAGNLSFTPDLNANDGSVNHLWPQSNFQIIGVNGKDHEFYDARVAQYGIDMINRMDGSRPWVMAAGFQHPHTGYACPQRFYDLYNPNAIVEPTKWSLGDLPRPTAYADAYVWSGTVWPSRDYANWQRHVWAYLASISHLDYEVGRLLDALDASPFADDTAIVFLSDHGYHAGDHNNWGKFTLWEEACRTPLIVKYPGQTSASVVNTPVSLMDVFPTILDLLGQPIPERIAGQSLVPLLPGQSGSYEDRGAISCVYGCVAIRFGDYRYILYPEETQELYNIATDPEQAYNLISSRPDIADMMRNQLVLECARYGLFHATGVLPSVREARAFALYNGARVEGGMGNDTYHISAASDVEIVDKGGRNRVVLGHWTEDSPYTVPKNIQEVQIGAIRSPIDPVIHMNNEGNFAIAQQKRYVAYGGAGNDEMRATNGSILYGGAGDDILDISGPQGEAHGGDGDDILIGEGATLYGGDGNDQLTSYGTAPAEMHGGPGDDIIQGAGGNDRLFGGPGRDTLIGGAGDDELHAGPGSSQLFGGLGDDILYSGGDDTLTGGPGTDTFVIGKAGTVQITDWQSGEVIDISSWAGGAAPLYQQVNANQVRITSGARSVLVNSLSPITISMIQGHVQI